jgi:hypothetical protein
VTLCNFVTVFAKTKSVTKSRLHCTWISCQNMLFVSQNQGRCHMLLGLARSQSYLKFTEKNKAAVVSCLSKFIALGLKTDHSARYKKANLINFKYLELGDTQWYVLTSWWFASWNSKGNAIKGTPRIIHDLQNFRRLFRPRGSPLKVA